MDGRCLRDGRLKLRHLLLLDALARHGSLVGAAAELHITQPVATRNLRELESILGVELYERGPRGVTPTIFGDAAAAHARAVITRLLQAGRYIAELADGARGTVVVGTDTSGSNLLLSRAIARSKARYPLVTVVVRTAPPEAVPADLESGRVDLVVGRLSAAAEPTIITEVLCTDFVELVVRADHPMVGVGNPTLRDLAEYTWILPATEVDSRGEYEEVFARSAMPLPERRIETSSFAVALQLLLETDMIAVLPRSLTATGDLRVAVLPAWSDAPEITVGMSRLVDRPMKPPTRALIEDLRGVAAEMRRG
nr:LysR substrate-binding domain-containing protein [Nocardia arthritidis]